MRKLLHPKADSLFICLFPYELWDEDGKVPNSNAMNPWFVPADRETNQTSCFTDHWLGDTIGFNR